MASLVERVNTEVITYCSVVGCDKSILPLSKRTAADSKIKQCIDCNVLVCASCAPNIRYCQNCTGIRFKEITTKSEHDLTKAIPSKAKTGLKIAAVIAGIALVALAALALLLLL